MKKCVISVNCLCVKLVTHSNVQYLSLSESKCMNKCSNPFSHKVFMINYTENPTAPITLTTNEQSLNVNTTICQRALEYRYFHTLPNTPTPIHTRSSFCRQPSPPDLDLGSDPLGLTLSQA